MIVNGHLCWCKGGTGMQRGIDLHPTSEWGRDAGEVHTTEIFCMARQSVWYFIEILICGDLSWYGVQCHSGFGSAADISSHQLKRWWNRGLVLPWVKYRAYIRRFGVSLQRAFLGMRMRHGIGTCVDVLHPSVQKGTQGKCAVIGEKKHT